MLKMEYFATWKANNNIRPKEDLSGTNKKKLISEVRTIANGNRFFGSTCEWWVWDHDKNIIAAGMTTSDGKHFMFHDYELEDIASDKGLIYKK